MPVSIEASGMPGPESTTDTSASLPLVRLLRIVSTASVRRLIVHGIHGIEREVQDDLLDLDSVSLDLRESWFEIGFE